MACLTEEPLGGVFTPTASYWGCSVDQTWRSENSTARYDYRNFHTVAVVGIVLDIDVDHTLPLVERIAFVVVDFGKPSRGYPFQKIEAKSMNFLIAADIGA